MNDRKQIKVLHVVGKMNRAGTETMLMNLFRQLNRDEVTFDFISYSQGDGDYDNEIKQLGGNVIKLTKTNSILQLVKVMKRHGPYDVIHSHTLFHCGIANVAAKLAGVNVRIAHAHTTLDNRNQLLRKWYMTLMRFLIEKCSTHYLACSKEAGHYLFGEKNVNKPKYAHFPNLIDYSYFFQNQEAEVRKFKEEHHLDESLVIGHIGRFTEAKNHRFLLEILSCLLEQGHNVRLMLVGEGELHRDLEDQAKKKGVHEQIVFAGKRDDIPTMLQSMDIFVFPSIYEGFGLVLLEAQASGVPCLVSEAIQPEADLGIQLMTQLSLTEGVEAWCEEILKHSQQRETDNHKILDAFEKKEYSLSTGLLKLSAIYQES